MKKIKLLCLGMFLFTSVYGQAPRDLNTQVKAESGDFYADDPSYGMVLTSPSGACYRLKVQNDGLLVVEPTNCPSTPGSSSAVEFVDVAGGTFDMGCTQFAYCDNDEFPVHSVTVDSFKLSKYEITNKQYAEFMNAIGVGSDGSLGGVRYLDVADTNCRIDYVTGAFVAEAGRETHPVVEVTWHGAEAFCVWAGGRLPTEAEWEYAARGGNQSQGYVYSGSNSAGTVAWYRKNDTNQVGIKNPNELGLYDMTGNAGEWCSDWYDFAYYSTSPTNNPQGPATGTLRVYRSGNFTIQFQEYLTVSQRLFRGPANEVFFLGFRCAKDL